MASDIEKQLKSKSEEQIKLAPKIDLWRTAARSEFAEVFYQAIHAGSGKIKSDKWLQRLEFETDRSFTRRAKFAKDFGWSKKIIDSYRGFFSGAEKNINIQGSDEIVNKLRTNIDNNGTTLEGFMGQMIDELLSVGRTEVITDAPAANIELVNTLDKLPYSYLVKREDVLDFGNDRIGDDFAFFRFKSIHSVIDGIRSKDIVKYIAFTREIIFIGIDQDKFEEIKIPNSLGYTPIRTVALGMDQLPIINAVAPIELDQMNLFTEIRNILSVQAISILHMPKTAFEKMGNLDVETVLVYPDDYSGLTPGWVDYPAKTLDAHFTYNNALIDHVFKISNLKKQDGNRNESGISKEFDWLDTESILNLLADEIEDVMNKIINHEWSDYSGTRLVSEITINRDFDVKGLKEQLDIILQAIAIVGENNQASKELKKQAVASLLPNISEEKKNEINDEIDQQISQTENLIFGEQK